MGDTQPHVDRQQGDIRNLLFFIFKKGKEVNSVVFVTRRPSPASYLAYSLTRKMMALCSSETPGNFYRATQHYISEDSIVQIRTFTIND
jgi:hypothetical protein